MGVRERGVWGPPRLWGLSHQEDGAGSKKRRVAGRPLLGTKWGHRVGGCVFEFGTRGIWEAGRGFPGWAVERGKNRRRGEQGDEGKQQRQGAGVPQGDSEHQGWCFETHRRRLRDKGRAAIDGISSITGESDQERTNLVNDRGATSVPFHRSRGSRAGWPGCAVPQTFVPHRRTSHTLDGSFS